MNELVEQLKTTLATVFSFYLKAHNYHWNVEGSDFAQYHSYLGDLYNEVFESVDAYAEHIRTLDAYAPGSLKRFSELTRIEDEVNVPTSTTIFLNLVRDNETILRELNTARTYAEANGKFGIVNFLEDRIDAHDKIGWQLRSFTK